MVFLIPFFLFFIAVQAQDTIVVQTLTLDSPTRSGSFEFPDDPNQSYRKILMQYTMRCLNGEVNPGNNSTGCHEWDYSCNTFLTDSTGVDSTRAFHPNYIISNYSDNTFNYTSQPTYTYYQYTQQEITYDNVISESVNQIGTGSDNLPHPFNTSIPVAKNQYLWTAAELMAAGVTAGDISSLRLDVSSLGSNLDFLRIKMKHTNQSTLDGNSMESDNFTNVYFLNTVPTSGMNSFNFHTPFNWDGTSNILVEFSYQNDMAGMQSESVGQDAGADIALVSGMEDRYLVFSGAENIDIPTTNFEGISDEITISFWSYGTEDALPTNTTIFEGVDDNNNRQANVHLPWSNGRIYWDCGNAGSGYDRIDKEANVSDFEGKWSHWTFTKNTNTGWMKIYLNGGLWHSGTGMTNPIDISTFKIGSSSTGTNKYHGALNEFRIWNKELSQTTIQEWMYKDLNASHPDWGNMVAYYQFNEPSGQIVMDNSANAIFGTINGAPARKSIVGEDIYRNMTASSMRPNVSFVQGVYTQSITNHVETIAEENGQHSVTEYSVSGTDLVEGNTIFVWQAADEVTYDEDGNVVASNPVNAENSISINDLEYYNKRPSKYELISFVTPYGFFLDLGPDGQTWTFDVTDFAPILKGSKYLTMERGGQYNEEFDIKFLFITGTPPREVQSIQNVWPFASGGFTAITNNNVFEPRNVMLSPDGTYFKMRTSVTGHQQNGEFQPRTHYINVDGGTNEYSFQVWKECGENPVYPQGGTWIFDRAGWCPGMPTDLRELDLTDFVTPGQMSEIDYGVIPVADQSSTNYLVSNQLVTYGAANFSNDAEALTVIRPTNDIEHGRKNPICNNPIVVIQNSGSNTLTSLDISYGTVGGMMETFTWTGSLDFLETEEVTLPTNNYLFWQTANTNRFEVTVSNPNGVADENPDNDTFTSTFDLTDKYEGAITFNYNTNNRAFQNTFRLRDQNGDIVLERTNMSNQTTYNDEITLMPGCYSMEFDDSGDDGLDFWYWQAVGQNVGTGYFRIVQNNQLVKTFEPDFGAFIHYDFFVDGTVSNENLEQNQILGVFPNPTQGTFSIELKGFEGRDVDVEVVDVMGRSIYIQSLDIYLEDFRHDIDISHLADGMYFVKINNEGKVSVKQVVKQGNH